MLHHPRRVRPRLQRELARWEAWAPALSAGVVVGCAYLLASWIGAALLSKTDGIAVFWPASGIAAAAMMVLDRRARGCVAAGIVVATLVVNLLAGRGPWLSLWLGVWDAGEALLLAWLVDRWSGRPFKFESWRGLWGFLAAAALAPAVATAGPTLAPPWAPTAVSFMNEWRSAAMADALGIVTIAPLLVGLHHLVGTRMSRRGAIEGMTALALLAAAGSAIYIAPPQLWAARVPPAALFPVLLWIAARCPPVLAAAAAFICAVILAFAAARHMGQLAVSPMPIAIIQVWMLIGSLCTLTLSALFSERRRIEGALVESNQRLRLALSGAELGVWSVDLTTDAFESDERDGRINGHDPAAPPRTLREARKFVHPKDLAQLDAAFRAGRQTGAPCRAEYRVLPGGASDPALTRWVAVEGNAVRDAAGRPQRLLGVTRDITERKLAEQALAERTAQLALAGQAGLVGSYSYETVSGMLQISPGFATIYGLPEDTTEITRADWIARVHPDDLPGFEDRRARTFRARERELLLEYRILRPDGEARWIEQRSLVSYRHTGMVRRIVGVQIDVTERKRDEEQKTLLLAELDHRVKNTLAVVSALISRTREGTGSVAELAAALDGRIRSMASTHELLSRSKWQGLSLRGLIERELCPYANGRNLTIEGPDVLLKAEAGQALAMVVHELVTNAAKYGALSAQGGRVAVYWQVAPREDAEAVLALDWLETDGPVVVPPTTAGYGSSVIRDLIPYELGGSVELTHPPGGVCCRLRIPAIWLNHCSGTASSGATGTTAPARRNPVRAGKG